MKKIISLFSLTLFACALMFGQAAQNVQIYSGTDKSGPCNPFPMSNAGPAMQYNSSTGHYQGCPLNSNPYNQVWTTYTPGTGVLAGDGYGGELAATTTGTGPVVQATAPTITNPILSVSIPLTLTQLQNLNTVPVAILPAVAGTMYVMGPCTLNLTYGSAAFTGGGTVSIGYGSTSSPATNGTIASTVFTSFTASHAVVVLPVAVAVTATTSLVNTAIYISAGSANFAAGTGATGQLGCQYIAVTGVS